MGLKVGFICEGESDEYILQSTKFIELLKKFDLELVSIQPTGGNRQMEDGRIEAYYKGMIARGCEKIVVLKDGDNDCKTSKLKVGDYQNMIITIAVREVENWYLADNQLIKNLNGTFNEIDFPESIQKPEKFINTICSKTYKGSKPALANAVIRKGFSIENAAKHPNCPSAKYFINKLKSIKVPL